MEVTLLNHQETAARGRMILSALAIMLPGVTFGTTISYLVQALPFFTSNNKVEGGIHMDEDQASWFVSLSQPVQMLGCLVACLTIDRLGRKLSLLLSSLITILAAILVFFSISFEMLLIGTLLSGLGIGISNNPAFTLLSEISLIKFRGALGSMNTLTINCGYLYGLVLGSMVSVVYLPLLLTLPSIVFLVVFWFIPESPVWLFKQGREDDAKSTLHFLRGKTYQIEPELKEIEAVVSSDVMDESKMTLLSREFLYPALVVSTTFFFQAFSGVDTLCYFMLIIFKDFAVEEKIVATLFQLFITLGYAFSPLIMSKIGRRPQFIIACLTTFLGMGSLGVHPLLPVNPVTSILPLVSIVVIGLSYGLGVGPVPFVLMSELFTTKFKAYGMALATITRAMCVFIQLKGFNALAGLVGVNCIFLGHSVLLILAAIFTFLGVPETRNKTLLELENIFSNNNNNININKNKSSTINTKPVS